MNKLRDQRRQAAKAAGTAYRAPADERIPEHEQDLGIADPLIVAEFRPYLGQKFTRVLDQFRGLLRNAVAHLDPTGKTGKSLAADKFEDVAECEQAIAVIKFISRMTLRNEILADPDLAGFSPPS